MRHTTKITMSAVLLLALSACGTPDLTQPALTQSEPPQSPLQISRSQSAVASAIALAKNAKVKDLGNQNGPSLAVAISAPASSRAILALQHRWVSHDILNYHVTLTAQSTGTEIAAVDIAPAAYNTSTTTAQALAAFTGLPANDRYTVKVVAQGINPVNAAAGVVTMNNQAPATAVFDFMENADHNIETVSNKSVMIALDSFEFSGTGNLSAQVQDGTFKAPSTPVAAKALVPTVTGGVNFGAWGWDITTIAISYMHMAPILCSDNQMRVPNTFIVENVDGALPGNLHAGYVAGFDAATGSGVFEWWMYAGQWNASGIHQVRVRMAYDNGQGVTGVGPIQGTVTL